MIFWKHEIAWKTMSINFRISKISKVWSSQVNQNDNRIQTKSPKAMFFNNSQWHCHIQPPLESVKVLRQFVVMSAFSTGLYQHSLMSGRTECFFGNSFHWAGGIQNSKLVTVAYSAHTLDGACPAVRWRHQHPARRPYSNGVHPHHICRWCPRCI